MSGFSRTFGSGDGHYRQRNTTIGSSLLSRPARALACDCGLDHKATRPAGKGRIGVCHSRRDERLHGRAVQDRRILESQIAHATPTALQQLPRIGQRRTVEEIEIHPLRIEPIDTIASDARSFGPKPMTSAL